MTWQLVCPQEKHTHAPEIQIRMLTAGFGSVMTQMSGNKGKPKKTYSFIQCKTTW